MPKLPKVKLPKFFSRKKDKYAFAEEGPTASEDAIDESKIGDLDYLCDSPAVKKIMEDEQATENLEFLKTYRDFQKNPSFDTWKKFQNMIGDKNINLPGTERTTLGKIQDPGVFQTADASNNPTKRILLKVVDDVKGTVSATIRNNIGYKKHYHKS